MERRFETSARVMPEIVGSRGRVLLPSNRAMTTRHDSGKG